jgi:hypothetical protein
VDHWLVIDAVDEGDQAFLESARRGGWDRHQAWQSQLSGHRDYRLYGGTLEKASPPRIARCPCSIGREVAEAETLLGHPRANLVAPLLPGWLRRPDASRR